MKPMKRIFTILLVCTSSLLFAQNWSPILVNEKMNFQHSDSSYISHTIWVDSSFYNGYDSIFYLNRVVKDVPGNPEIVLRNQPQFLMEFMVQQTYGIYSFHYPFNYSISTGLPLGATWLFDLTNIIDAEITACYEEEIFGVLDSVKMISLSDGNEILLSKNFGILKFPDFENGGIFELVGIQNTDYGESVPGFWDIFDFEVGDVFQYTGSVGGGGSMYIDYYTKKYTISSKSIEPGEITYSYQGIRKGMIWDIGNPWNSYGYSDIISGNLVYTETGDLYSNLFPSELTKVLEGWCGLSYDYNSYARTNYYLDTIQTKTKQIGFAFDLNGYAIGELLAIPDEFSDTLIRLTDFFPPEGVIGITLKENLGIISYIAYYFEDEDDYYLEGYIKDGDTVGIITPDSLLHVGINKNDAAINNISIFPNPANDWLNIKFTNTNSSQSYNIELRNLHGQLVRKEKNIQSSLYVMNIEGLKPGVYFYIIKEKGEIVQQGKLIKK